MSVLLAATMTRRRGGRICCHLTLSAVKCGTGHAHPPAEARDPPIALGHAFLDVQEHPEVSRITGVSTLTLARVPGEGAVQRVEPNTFVGDECAPDPAVH